MAIIVEYINIVWGEVNKGFAAATVEGAAVGAAVGHLVGQRVHEDVQEAQQLFGDAPDPGGLVPRKEPGDVTHS